MLTIYIHRKKVADIICMVYALMFTNLLNYCNLIRARTYDQMGVCGIWIDCSVFSGAVYLHPDLRLEDGSHQSGDIDGGAGHPQWIRWLFPLSCGA